MRLLLKRCRRLRCCDSYNLLIYDATLQVPSEFPGTFPGFIDLWRPLSPSMKKMRIVYRSNIPLGCDNWRFESANYDTI